MNGIKDGFHIIDPDCVSHSVEIDNYTSATAENVRAQVESQILTEIQNGRYRIVDRKPAIISALGAIPKKDSNNVRLIHDASRPSGQALNDYAINDHFQYQSIQDAVDLIAPNCYLAKVDLANAYRSTKIHPSNFKATGLKWRFKNDNQYTYLIDERLPFGASRSPQIFNTITQAVRAIMARKGFKTIVCYLDDFLIIASTYDECLHALNVLLRLLRELGFHINYNKLEGPCQRLVFLGITLDSTSMTLSIPQEKMNEVKQCMNTFMLSRNVTKRQIQSLAGKLNWITQCVYGGRFHMRRLIESANKLRKPWHRQNVTKDMKQDILWWLNFMEVFNGCMPMVDCRPVSYPVCIDACKIAAGAFHQGDFVYNQWTANVASLPINYLEVLALEPAVKRWAHLWTNKKVFIHCDNVTACTLINKGTCKNVTVMAALRRIFWYSAIYNFRLRAIYYPGQFNKLADSVSRLHETNGLIELQTAMTNCGYF